MAKFGKNQQINQKGCICVIMAEGGQWEKQWEERGSAGPPLLLGSKLYPQFTLEAALPRSSSEFSCMFYSLDPLFIMPSFFYNDLAKGINYRKC